MQGFWNVDSQWNTRSARKGMQKMVKFLFGIFANLANGLVPTGLGAC